MAEIAATGLDKEAAVGLLGTYEDMEEVQAVMRAIKGWLESDFAGTEEINEIIRMAYYNIGAALRKVDYALEILIPVVSTAFDEHNLTLESYNAPRDTQEG